MDYPYSDRFQGCDVLESLFTLNSLNSSFTDFYARIKEKVEKIQFRSSTLRECATRPFGCATFHKYEKPLTWL